MKKILLYRSDGIHWGRNANPKYDTVVAEALVSDEDYPYVSQRRYGLTQGYPCRMEGPSGNQKTIFLHNEIAARMGLVLKPGETADHIDRDKRNCQRDNFRAATRSLQQINQRLKRHSTSGVPGVSWHKRDKVWQAHASLGGVLIMKRFKTKEEAIHARKVMEIERQQVMALTKEI
jgi:hypothetical protein